LNLEPAETYAVIDKSEKHERKNDTDHSLSAALNNPSIPVNDSERYQSFEVKSAEDHVYDVSL